MHVQMNGVSSLRCAKQWQPVPQPGAGVSVQSAQVSLLHCNVFSNPYGVVMRAAFEPVLEPDHQSNVCLHALAYQNELYLPLLRWCVTAQLQMECALCCAMSGVGVRLSCVAGLLNPH